MVLKGGTYYNSPPDLVITGDGVGAVITPVIENNAITSITVIEKGSGYTQANTSIEVLVLEKVQNLEQIFKIGE